MAEMSMWEISGVEEPNLLMPEAILLSKGCVPTNDCFGVAWEEFRAEDGFPRVAAVDWGESSG